MLPRFLLAFFLLFSLSLSAQLPVACGSGAGPAVACEQACIFCNFDGYTGSTTGYPSVPAVDFCGTVENAQWLGFIAGATEATFTVTPFDCSDGNGVQVAVYQDCTQAPLACDQGEADGAGIPVSITLPVSPGSSYFLMIDGYAGDQCSFSVDIFPPEAVYEPALGLVQDISGPLEGCPGATFTYTVQPVQGAGAYIWDGPPGTLVNGDSVPVVAERTVSITLGEQSGPICVQAANACSVNPPCTASLFVTVLGDAARPRVEGDSLASLNCLNTPIRLMPEIDPPGNYIYTWSSDSSGQIVSGQQALRPEVSTIGVYTLVVTNTLTGCTGTDSIRVGPPELPVPEALEILHVRCYGYADGSARLGPIPGGTPPFLYSLDDAPFQPLPEFRRLEPGLHRIAVEDAAGCAWDTVFQITQPDELLVDLPPDTALDLGHTLRLWTPAWINFPDRVAQTAVRPEMLAPWLCDTCVYCPLNSFRYHITVTDSAGCSASDERQVVVEKERRVYIPNVFRPESGADSHEPFQVFCGPDVAGVLALRVYNRWGHLVHERNDLKPNDAAGAWDGRLDGRLLPPGVYLYQAEVRFKDGAVERYQGDVTLVR